MNKICLLCMGIIMGLMMLRSSFINAATGDTISIQAHNHVDMVWYGNYDQVVEFPTDESLSYSKILMNYTIGCATAQCSDWDYTVHLEVGMPTGIMQDQISSIDTISTNPLVIDTSYISVEVIKWVELGRMITPYGTYMDTTSPSYGTSGFNSDWTHSFTFDVSDYVLLLKGSKTIRCFYSGWSTGFSSTISFDFIEGLPCRDVIAFDQVYDYGGMPYDNTSNFELNYVYTKKFKTLDNADAGHVNVFVSGHGIDNQECSEFCTKNYYLKANDTQLAQYTIWRDDCGKNPLKPQGGTWLFNRGNWCPGDQVYRNAHDISSQMSPGDSIEIDIDFTPYSNGGGSYALEAQYVQYGPARFSNDVEIVDIIAPSNKDMHMHYNPICNNPSIKIRNNGANTLTSCIIEFGTTGPLVCHHQWEGSLAYNEEVEVALPAFMWAGFDIDNPVFFARVGKPNGMDDEYMYNNRMESSFSLPPRFDDSFVLKLKTNNKANENHWTITSMDGTVMYENGTLANNTTYTTDINLPMGCYTFLLTDYGTDWDQGDGLSFWYNLSQGIETSGFVRFEKNNQIIQSFDPDFGDEIRFQFIVDYDMANDIPAFIECEELALETGIEEVVDLTKLKLYPNPATDVLNILYEQEGVNKYRNALHIYNSLGQLVHSDIMEHNRAVYQSAIDIQHWASGIYIVSISNGNSVKNQKLIIE